MPKNNPSAVKLRVENKNWLWIPIQDVAVSLVCLACNKRQLLIYFPGANNSTNFQGKNGRKPKTRIKNAGSSVSVKTPLLQDSRRSRSSWPHLVHIQSLLSHPQHLITTAHACSYPMFSGVGQLRVIFDRDVEFDDDLSCGFVIARDLRNKTMSLCQYRHI